MTDTPRHEDRAGGHPAANPAELRLGGWSVHPSLNRLSRDGRDGSDGTTVRLEPKLMDVLLLLIRKAGTVVSKDEIADAVWPRAYLSESVITRAIAGLRRALEDDAHQPRFIETIAKRGYRLLLAATPAAPEPDIAAPTTPLPPAAERTPPPRPAGARPATPFVVGQWVRGAGFAGRTDEIAEILDGPRNGIWLLGCRAIGKTSLLKQLEHLTATDPEGTYFPLFWDLQGSVEPAALAADFQAALAETEERLAALGLSLAEVESDDLVTALGRLRRALGSRGRTLLLLLDEAEELLHLHAADPTLLRKLRRALQSQEGIRTVMASGPRLWRLAAQRDDTSPFLHGFAPPLHLGPLREDEARGVIARSAELGRDADLVARLIRHSGRHPSVLQLLCTRTLELGDPERAAETVAGDPTIRLFFSVDFDLFSPAEKRLTLILSRDGESRSAAGADGTEALAAQQQLERLGVLRRNAAGAIELASGLFRRWLAALPADAAGAEGSQNV